MGSIFLGFTKLYKIKLNAPLLVQKLMNNHQLHNTGKNAKQILKPWALKHQD